MTGFFLSLLTYGILSLLATDVHASPVGQMARDFNLKDLEGRDVRLSQFKDKIVLLHFWALWCGSCKDEMPSLNSVLNTYRERGVEVLTISTDTSINRLEEFVSQKKLTLPILLDTDKKVTVDVYGVIGIPVTLIIDRNGKVLEKIQGARDWSSHKMRAKIEALLRIQGQRKTAPNK